MERGRAALTLLAMAIAGAAIGFAVHRYTSAGSGRYLVRQGASGQVLLINQMSGAVQVCEQQRGCEPLADTSDTGPD
jgi:hypothetical protein